MSAAIDKLAEKLRKVALSYPETYEESPWGDRVVKVRKKIFLFCGAHEGALHLSVKLPHSGREALKRPGTQPTPYGLGKSGWVSASLTRVAPEEEALIAQWIDESYRALAPKTLVKLLDQPASPTPARAPSTGKTAKPKVVKARVMLVCEDALRSERAVSELGERGVKVTSVENVQAVRKKLGALDAVIIDLGRSQDEGLELAGEIDASDREIHLFLAGVRDGKTDKRAALLATSAERFRDPPGDPAVADAIAATRRAHS